MITISGSREVKGVTTMTPEEYIDLLEEEIVDLRITLAIIKDMTSPHCHLQDANNAAEQALKVL